ncbi:MAG TPA: hypothetical protein VF610_09965 [Segetibacter sp.]|jgi:hypothetical protein
MEKAERQDADERNATQQKLIDGLLPGKKTAKPVKRSSFNKHDIVLSFLPSVTQPVFQFFAVYPIHTFVWLQA